MKDKLGEVLLLIGGDGTNLVVYVYILFCNHFRNHRVPIIGF